MRRPVEMNQLLELTFFAVFSIFIIVFFFALLSINGLVLGNDPAVHIQRANSFLVTGTIPISDIAWTPPLFHIVLAALIEFTGATSIGQIIFLVKSIAVIINWLLIFSVYLISARFLGRKIGFFASLFLLLSFPLYELNFYGGYTTILSLAFMLLLFLYLSLEEKGFENTLVISIFAFSLVLTHQLTTFLALFIFPPFILVMLLKYRGRYRRTWVAALLGGVIAFLIYYFLPLLPYLNTLIDIIFFQLKAMLYQVPSVTPYAFMVNFGFILFFAFSGLVIAFFKLRQKKLLSFYLLLALGFFVPLFFSQSYLVGFYLPFQRFVYYLLPIFSVFAAVTFYFIVDLILNFYGKYRTKWTNLRFKTCITIIIFLVATMFLFRFGVVHNKIMEGSTYYSTSDIKGFDAGSWLRTNYPEPTTIVVTEIPGSWFGLFSGKRTIAQTDPIVEWNVIAESVLDLTYELEHPLTLVRAYDMTKGDVSDESYVSINDVWSMVSYSAADGNFLSYSIKGIKKEIALSNFNRESVFEDKGSPKNLTIHYFNDEVSITQTILLHNDTYSVYVAWTLSPKQSEISDVTLYVSTFFNLQFSFEEAYIPGVLDWENPWSKPSDFQEDWAVVNFSRSTLKDNYLGFYDATEKVILALNLQELPDWGNVGALASKQIDAFRLRYNFNRIEINRTASFTYQFLTFSKTSSPETPNLKDLKSIFEFKPATAFDVKTRDYHDYITENKIGFIVYDKNQLDTKIIRCKILELVYSNNRYAVFKIKKIS